MERRCEYCMALRAVVLCESDAAHLCLSCDAKVHSANALSHRHPRTLVCDSCRSQPALVRCPDHQMFMCQSCDITHHAASLDHHNKKLVSCYVGCPSARDLAELWGFHFKPQSSLVSALYTQSGGLKVVNDDSQQNSSSSFILQQIMDLEILQLSDDSFLAHVEAERRHDATWREIRMHHLEHSDATLLGKSEEPLPSPFPQLDSLTNTGNPLNGDAFWQFRRPVHTNEIWHQNMQDLGVCEEVQSFDDVKIPEVDVTFQSFEEVFGDEKKKKQQQHLRVEV